MEILSPCPTNVNLGMTPEKCIERMDTVVSKYYKTGEYVDKGGNI